MKYIVSSRYWIGTNLKICPKISSAQRDQKKTFKYVFHRMIINNISINVTYVPYNVVIILHRTKGMLVTRRENQTPDPGSDRFYSRHNCKLWRGHLFMTWNRLQRKFQRIAACKTLALFTINHHFNTQYHLNETVKIRSNFIK